MPPDDIFPVQADLAGSKLANEIEDMLVDVVESVFPAADRSEADIERLDLDRNEWQSHVRARVVVKNSTEAGPPNPLGGPNLGHFSITSTVKFDFDLKTGETSNEHLTIYTNGPDISLNIGTIKEVLEGDWAKALELIPNGGLVEREIHSDYDRIRNSYYDKYGRENVYFASARFVRWASVGTVGKWVAQAIASGGSVTPAIMAEVKKEALKELNVVGEWLLAHGQQEALSVAQKLLSGEQIDWPQIKLVSQTVRYASRLLVSNRQVGSEFAVNRHAAFVIIWHGAPMPPPDLLPIQDDEDLDTDEPDTPPRDANIRNQRRGFLAMLLG